jgi:predicted Zn-dependent protease
MSGRGKLITASYIEDRVIRADNTIMLGLKMVGNSGFEPDEKVQVSTVIDSGKIVIERMKKEMATND